MNIYREIPDRDQRRKRGYEIYTSFPNASFDMSVMERAENVCVAVGEFGWDGAASAYLVIDPENQIGVYYGQHVFGCSELFATGHQTIRDLVYDCLGLGD